jgi:hypothetical protein
MPPQYGLDAPNTWSYSSASPGRMLAPSLKQFNTTESVNSVGSMSVLRVGGSSGTAGTICGAKVPAMQDAMSRCLSIGGNRGHALDNWNYYTGDPQGIRDERSLNASFRVSTGVLGDASSIPSESSLAGTTGAPSNSGDPYPSDSTVTVKRTETNCSTSRHQCSICLKTFTRSTTLREHTRIHTNSFPFSCETCDTRFARVKDWKRHEATHSGERNFICRGDGWGCGHRFARADALVKHFRSGIGKKCGEARTIFERNGNGIDTGLTKKKESSATGNLQIHKTPAATQKISSQGQQAISGEGQPIQESSVSSSSRHHWRLVHYAPVRGTAFHWFQVSMASIADLRSPTFVT